MMFRMAFSKKMQGIALKIAENGRKICICPFFFVPLRGNLREVSDGNEDFMLDLINSIWYQQSIFISDKSL